MGDVSFANGIARVELCVTRRDANTEAATGVVNVRHPACRLVMSHSTLIRLHTRLSETLEAMQRAGLLTGGEPPKN